MAYPIACTARRSGVPSPFGCAMGLQPIIRMTSSSVGVCEADHRRTLEDRRILKGDRRASHEARTRSPPGFGKMKALHVDCR